MTRNHGRSLRCLKLHILQGFFLASLLLWASGCEISPLADGLPSEYDCSSCHGTSDSPAPPLSVRGAWATSDIGVGAHSEHLSNGKVSQAIECSECHIVPATVLDLEHVDPLPAEVVFGSMASTDGAVPTWDHDSARCSNTYCHGATLEGGSDKSPDWTLVDGSQVACGSCHGNPPPAPHPDSDACHACHSETAAEDGSILVESGRHIDGVVDVTSDNCSACHGSDENAAPPMALDGSTDTSSPGVGAHQVHLNGGTARAGIPCSECHLVPDVAEDPQHLDGGGAEITWGALALSGNSQPLWHSEELTCENTWCHGAGLTGGEVTVPVWNKVDGSQSTCGSCHGNPPPSPHVISTACSMCHSASVDETGAIEVDGGKHINGVLDAVEPACNECHGDENSPAPPVDTQGNVSTSEPGVGAHRSHLGLSDWHREVTCDQCHVVPSVVNEVGHADTALPAELSWGELAADDGAVPSYAREETTCSGVYCHGATLMGTGSNREPIWTNVGQGEADCGSCHGLPPEAPHPAQSQWPSGFTCASCHGCVADGYQIRAENAYLHINGVTNLESMGSCPSM